MANGFSISRRENVLATSGGVCWYCGKPLTMKTLTIDHVEPVSMGGSNHPRNLVPSCKSCNCKKKDRTMDDFRAIMSRNEHWIPFSEAQKSMVYNLTGVDLDALMSNEPYVFWFETRK